MSLENITLNDIKDLLSILNDKKNNNSKPLDDFIGKHCVVRTYSAGVHIGTVDAIEDTHVSLSNARRIFGWNGAFTLSEVASDGVNINTSRISKCIDRILLTEAIEIIPTSVEARQTFDKCHEK